MVDKIVPSLPSLPPTKSPPLADCTPKPAAAPSAPSISLQNKVSLLPFPALLAKIQQQEPAEEILRFLTSIQHHLTNQDVDVLITMAMKSPDHTLLSTLIQAWEQI